MPTLSEYRSTFSVEAGPYIGPDSYDVRAMTGSSTTQLYCLAYPIMSGIPRSDLVDLPLFRPNAVQPSDRDRRVKTYTPSTGLLEPDLPWINSPLAAVTGTTYGNLEAFTYGDLEALGMTYGNLENTGAAGFGERFEILGPFDAPTTHRLINDGLKQCWLIVEVVCQPSPLTTRHDLTTIVPWLQDASDILQVGVLTSGQDRNLDDPYSHIVRGQVDQDGFTFYFNTGTRSFNANELLYIRCLKRAYDHCRSSGGCFGDRAGLEDETDEAPIERDWLASSALVIAWRRYGHLLEPLANQRLIRDQASAAAWFTDRCREHFTAPLPQRTFRPRRSFGPPALVA